MGGRDGRETSGTGTPEGGRRLVLVSSPKTAVRKIQKSAVSNFGVYGAIIFNVLRQRLRPERAP